MTNVMYDSIDVNAYPTSTELALAYGNGRWPNAPDVQARFPKAIVKVLSVEPSGYWYMDGFDCEVGNGNAGEAALWAQTKMQLYPNTRPLIYCSRIGSPGYGWDDCKTALMNLNVHPMDVDFGIADYTSEPHCLVGSVFTQWADSTFTGGNYDESLTNGLWPYNLQPPTIVEGSQMIASTPSGKGYRVVRPDGSVWDYGDATYHGGLNQGASVNGGPPNPASLLVAGDAATGIASCLDGYWVTTAKGFTYAFGQAQYLGSPDF